MRAKDCLSAVYAKIAENVIDCSYSGRNKVHDSSDIRYITSDHTLHIYQTEKTESEISAFPENIVAAAGDMGHYPIQQEDGASLYGSLTESATERLGIRGQGCPMDFFGSYCTYIDEKGKIHPDCREPGSYDFLFHNKKNPRTVIGAGIFRMCIF